MVSICVVYEINMWPFNVGKVFLLGNSLFGVVKLTKNADLGKCSYFGYDIEFDAFSAFLLSSGVGFD